MTIDPNLPCGYCVGAGPLCGAPDDDNHDDMDCPACARVKLSDPHPECIEMVNEYMREHAGEA